MQIIIIISIKNNNHLEEDRSIQSKRRQDKFYQAQVVYLENTYLLILFVNRVTGSPSQEVPIGTNIDHRSAYESMHLEPRPL